MRKCTTCGRLCPLKLRGNHVVIRKVKGRPAGRDHINGIEGFRSYAKNWLYPYRGAPSKYFHLNLGEICYRFNHRSEDLKPFYTNSYAKPQSPNRPHFLSRSEGDYLNKSPAGEGGASCACYWLQGLTSSFPQQQEQEWPSNKPKAINKSCSKFLTHLPRHCRVAK